MTFSGEEILVPPKPKRLGWPTHVYRLLIEHRVDVDHWWEGPMPALRFSRADYEDLIRSMEKYVGRIEADPSIEKQMFGCPVIVDEPGPKSERAAQ